MLRVAIQPEDARIELVLRAVHAVRIGERQLRFVHYEGGILYATVPAAHVFLRISATVLARELLLLLLFLLGILNELMLLHLMLLRFDVAQHHGLVVVVVVGLAADDAARRRRLVQLQSTGQTLQLLEHLLLATPAQRRRQHAEQCQAIDDQANDVANQLGEAVR